MRAKKKESERGESANEKKLQRGRKRSEDARGCKKTPDEGEKTHSHSKETREREAKEEKARERRAGKGEAGKQKREYQKTQG